MLSASKFGVQKVGGRIGLAAVEEERVDDDLEPPLLSATGVGVGARFLPSHWSFMELFTASKRSAAGGWKGVRLEGLIGLLASGGRDRIGDVFLAANAKDAAGWADGGSKCLGDPIVPIPPLLLLLWMDSDCDIVCFTDSNAMEATISACRLPFRRPKKLRPCSCSVDDGANMDVAAALAVDKAVASDPPAIKMDRAAVMACEVAWDKSSASSDSVNGPRDGCLAKERREL
jgi:hypothetical protein